MSLSGSLWADTVLGEEHSDTEGRLEESTPLKEMRSEKEEGGRVWCFLPFLR